MVRHYCLWTTPRAHCPKYVTYRTISRTHVLEIPKTNVDRVAAHEEKMELNAKKCKELIINFRKNKTIIPETRTGNQPIPR